MQNISRYTGILKRLTYRTHDLRITHVYDLIIGIWDYFSINDESFAKEYGLLTFPALYDLSQESIN